MGRQPLAYGNIFQHHRFSGIFERHFARKMRRRGAKRPRGEYGSGNPPRQARISARQTGKVHGPNATQKALIGSFTEGGNQFFPLHDFGSILRIPIRRIGVAFLVERGTHEILIRMERGVSGAVIIIEHRHRGAYPVVDNLNHLHLLL